MKLADCCLLITVKFNTVKCFHLLVLLKCEHSLEELLFILNNLVGFFYTLESYWTPFDLFYVLLNESQEPTSTLGLSK